MQHNHVITQTLQGRPCRLVVVVGEVKWVVDLAEPDAVGNRDQRPQAAPGVARQSGDRPFGIGDVFEPLEHHDRVETVGQPALEKLDRVGLRKLEPAGLRELLLGRRDHSRFDVDAEHEHGPAELISSDP